MHQLFRWLPQISLPGQIHLSHTGPTSFHTHFAVRQINNMPSDKRRSATNISPVSPRLLAVMFSFISSWGINDHQQFTHCTPWCVANFPSALSAKRKYARGGVKSYVRSAAINPHIPPTHPPRLIRSIYHTFRPASDVLQDLCHIHTTVAFFTIKYMIQE